MTYLVASLTLDSARSYVMYGASFTQRKVSIVPFVSSISPEGFLPLILLLVVIIARVVVTEVVVVFVGGVPSILKLSFMVIDETFKQAFDLLDSLGTVLLPSGRGMIHNELSNSAKIDSSKEKSDGGVVDLIDDEDEDNKR
uniref:Uncharacterized protein n=1 Tax=Tanacetum cinerariifolium TaxID=118510 RepID=A0A6L2KR66_TANCI|nr:hypothetical protein [Tanacetum cinerariifolium]